jgi:hypothetical protein
MNEECDGEYSDTNFFNKIQNHIHIKCVPTSFDEIGKKLLSNGIFVVAYIKYFAS